VHYLEPGRECQGVPTKKVDGKYVGTADYLEFVGEKESPHTAVWCDIYDKQGCRGKVIWSAKHHGVRWSKDITRRSRGMKCF
jgi:hypothetical protein